MNDNPGMKARNCTEKACLLRSYDDATREFSGALATLNARMGVTSKAEYRRLEHLVTEARQKSDDARNAYERHVREHGC